MAARRADVPSQRRARCVSRAPRALLRRGGYRRAYSCCGGGDGSPGGRTRAGAGLHRGRRRHPAAHRDAAPALDAPPRHQHRPGAKPCSEMGSAPAARGTAQPRGTVRPAGAQQAALSARAASGCPELWSASENQPLGPRSCRAVISALLWTQERSTGALCSAQISPHASAASAAHVAASLRGGHFSVRRRARVRARARVVLRVRVRAAAPAPCAGATRQASDTPTACPPSMA